MDKKDVVMDRKDVVVLDTNVLIDNPRALFAFPDSLLVIPSIVIDELDNLKDSKRVEVRRHSRIASNYIDAITEGYEESDTDFMYLENGGILTIDGNYDVCFDTRETDKPDNIIISSAIRYATNEAYDSVTMYSNDTNVRNKTRVQARKLKLKYKVKARHYAVIDQSLEDISSGVANVVVPDDSISRFRKGGMLSIELPYMNGEHIYLQGESNPDKNQALGIWNRTLKRVEAIVDFKKGEPIWSIGGGKEGATAVRPRDSRQNFLANDLLNIDKNLHFVLSRVAGAGKNFITTACALSLLKDGHYDRLIMIKPMVSVEGSDLGYLPGTKEEKISPFFESFNDTWTELTSDGQMHGLEDLEARIELDVVTHMRGRSIPNVIMIIDECQNFSPDAVKTLLTRAGENAKIILMGDLSQIDNPRLDSSNCGLRVWAEKARHPESGYDKSSYILLDSNFRSELSAWASTFYE